MAKGLGKSALRQSYGRDDDGGEIVEPKTAYSWSVGVTSSEGSSWPPSSESSVPNTTFGLIRVPPPNGGFGGTPGDTFCKGAPRDIFGKGALSMPCKDGIWDKGGCWDQTGSWDKGGCWGKGKETVGPWSANPWSADPWGNGVAWAKGKGKDPWGVGSATSLCKGGKWMGQPQFVSLQKPQWQTEAERYPGLLTSMKDCLAPVAHLEDKWSAEEMMQRVTTYVVKAADQYANDDRLHVRGSPIQAQAIVEEYVEIAMGSIVQGCYDKPWVSQALFSQPLCLVAEQIFKTAKLFCRMLAPMLHKYVEDALFRFREEERMRKAIWETVETSGLPDAYFKKCNNYLLKAYDEAHVSAAYGVCVAEKQEMGLLQDFVKGWMKEFIHRGWDVLENGVGAREEQVVFVTKLFQILCHERLCLPHDLIASLDASPPPNWPFVAQTAIEEFLEMDQPTSKQRKKWSNWAQG